MFLVERVIDNLKIVYETVKYGVVKNTPKWILNIKFVVYKLIKYWIIVCILPRLPLSSLFVHVSLCKDVERCRKMVQKWFIVCRNVHNIVTKPFTQPYILDLKLINMPLG